MRPIKKECSERALAFLWEGFDVYTKYGNPEDDQFWADHKEAYEFLCNLGRKHASQDPA